MNKEEVLQRKIAELNKRNTELKEQLNYTRSELDKANRILDAVLKEYTVSIADSREQIKKAKIAQDNFESAMQNAKAVKSRYEREITSLLAQLRRA